MKSVKALVASIAIVSLMAMLVGTAVMGATVTATVTAQNVAVSVTDGSIAYGIVNGSEDTTSSVTTGIDDTQVVSNDGNVPENFDIAGTNSTDWQLGAAAGDATYEHAWCTSNCDSSPTWSALSTSANSLATSVATSGTQAVDFQITVPTSNAGTNSENVDVNITASAS